MECNGCFLLVLVLVLVLDFTGFDYEDEDDDEDDLVAAQGRARFIRDKFSVMKIRLFIKPYCPWCHRAMAWLDGRGIRYEKLDVIADSKAYTEMVNLSGQTLAPVMDVDGKILADFGPDELAKFWEKLETSNSEH